MTQTAARPTALAGWRHWHLMILAGIGGAVAAFGLAPFGIWPLSLAGWALVPALMAMATSRWRAAALGWAFSAGFFAHSLHWIIEPFLVDPVRHGWMAPFALVFLAGGLALFWGAAFWGAFALGRSALWRVALLVPLLGLAEFVRAYLFTGFPWAAPAQAFIDSPALSLLRWVGPHGLGVLALAAAFGLGSVPFADRRTRMLAVAPALLLAALAAVSSTTRTPAGLTEHRVRLVQPNAPQHQKWDPEFIPFYFSRHLELTSAGTTPDLAPDLVVWSESAIAPILERAGPHFDLIAESTGGAQVALGIRRYDGGRFYNTLVRLDETGAVAGRYDKHHLVPFGEYIPLGNVAKRFGIHGIAAEDGDGYSAGPGPALIDFGPLGKALPLICYEAVFPQDLNGAPGRADFLLQVTNDAWFGAWSGPYQHLAQARMRAAEQGLPMVRAANTGISAVIDANGAVIASLGLGQAGVVDAFMPAPHAPTLYARTGDKAAFGLILLLLIALLARRPRRIAVSD